MSSQGLCDQNSIRNEFDQLDQPFQSCMQKRDTCALVGSSSHLLGAGFGAEIDRHELVVRLNTAPAGNATNGFVEDVGSKTTTRFVNIQGFFPAEDMARGLCVFLFHPKKPGCLRNKACRVQDFRCAALYNGTRNHGTNSMGSNYVFLDFVHDSLAKSVVRELGQRPPVPTAGLMAVMHLLHICRSITVYGFGPSCDGSIGLHYYDNNSAEVSPDHVYNRELAMLMNLSSLPDVSSTPLRPLGSWVQSDSLVVKIPLGVEVQFQSC